MERKENRRWRKNPSLKGRWLKLTLKKSASSTIRKKTGKGQKIPKGFPPEVRNERWRLRTIDQNAPLHMVVGIWSIVGRGRSISVLRNWRSSHILLPLVFMSCFTYITWVALDTGPSMNLTVPTRTAIRQFPKNVSCRAVTVSPTGRDAKSEKGRKSSGEELAENGKTKNKKTRSGTSRTQCGEAR